MNDHLPDFLDPSVKRTRTAAAKFSEEEYRILQRIADWREQQGKSASLSDFIRQCVHYALRSDPSAQYMAVPPADYLTTPENPDPHGEAEH